MVDLSVTLKGPVLYNQKVLFMKFGLFLIFFQLGFLSFLYIRIFKVEGSGSFGIFFFPIFHIFKPISVVFKVSEILDSALFTFWI